MEYELEEKLQRLDGNKEIEAIYRVRNRGKTPPYIVVGNGVATKNFPEDVVKDAFEVFGDLTKTQQNLFNNFKDIWVKQAMVNHYSRRIVDNPNLIVLDVNKNNELHQSIRTRMAQNCNGSRLEEKGVLRKIKSGRYMLNPYIFIPSGDFEKVAELWEEVGKKS